MAGFTEIGAQIGWTIAVVVLIVAIVAIVIDGVGTVLEFWWGGFLAVIGALVAVIALASMFFGFAWHLDARYHRVYQITGTLESVSQRFENASGDLSTTPVVRIDTAPLPLLVDDSRIFAFDSGDEITLNCRVEWVHLSADRIHCWVGEP